MTLEDIIRALNGGDPEAAAYLNDPRATVPGRPPLPMPTTPAWRQEMGALPRPSREAQAPLAWEDTIPMGPGAGARPAPQRPALIVAPPSRRGMPADSPGMFADATSYLRAMSGYSRPHPSIAGRNPELDPVEPTPWRQPEQIDANEAVSRNALPVGSLPVERGIEPPSAPRSSFPVVDDDADWNAALARVRANMGRDPTGLREWRDRELEQLRGRARRDQMVASAPQRYNWPRTIR